MTHWRAVARCMRARGVPAFPSPRASVPHPLANIGVVSDRDGAILALPATIDTASPVFTAAAAACGLGADAGAAAAADRRRAGTRQTLLLQSGIALAAMSLLSLGLGWLMAGRVLQPLIDSYDAQRRFVANASHELRAPLTRLRALSEVALANPTIDAGALRHAHERVLASEQDLERLIDGLLALSRGQAGQARREPVDLATLVAEAIPTHAARADAHGLELRTTLAAAPTAGDPRLLDRLIANLIDNAIRHNIENGHVALSTGVSDRHAVLAITNSGPEIQAAEIDRLFEPFQRLGGTRTGHGGGHGLGLSIVRAIADAHHAEISARPINDGGLGIEIHFPHAPATDAPARRSRRRLPITSS
jgi:signal transduction histidine kinase